MNPIRYVLGVARFNTQPLSVGHHVQIHAAMSNPRRLVTDAVGITDVVQTAINFRITLTETVGVTDAVAAARARVVEATANRDRSLGVFERFERGFDSGAFAEVDLENRRQLYNADEAALQRAEADHERARIAFEAGIDGENPDVARIQAELEKAR